MKNPFLYYCLFLSSPKFQIFSSALAIKRYYHELPKRFYRNVNVITSEGDNCYEIILDQKKLKTPQGNIFKLFDKSLAYAVAAEWDSQKKRIQRNTMHLTVLCNTVIDNPNAVSKSILINEFLNFLDTDTIVFYTDEDNELYRLQQERWTPAITWFNEKYEANIKPIRGIQYSSGCNNVEHLLERQLHSYNFASIHGLVYAAQNLKSLILTLSCIDQNVSVEEVVSLSRLEEEFQTGNWGRVEWAHDFNLLDLQSRISCAVMFVRLNLNQEAVIEIKKSV